MSNAQRKIVDKLAPVSAVEAGPSETMGLFPEASNVLASPARALQAKLSNEMQPVIRFEARHPVLTAITVFVAACAGTWVFGALLYTQF